MKQLEEFMRDHRDSFDNELPSGDLWEKIEDQLNQKDHRAQFRHKWIPAVAAVLVLALVTGLLINRYGEHRVSYTQTIDPGMQDLLETEAYYSSMVSGKMGEIEKCYTIYPELKSDIEGDLQQLELMYRELKQDLNQNLYNREVIEAMIQNNRTRLEMVDRVLNQINC